MEIATQTQLIEHPQLSLSWASPLRDAVTCLSLANICFLRVWEETLSYRKTEAYLMKQVPTPADFLATLSAVVLAAAALFAVVWFCRKRLSHTAFRIVRFASFALVLIPLNGLRAALSLQDALGSNKKYFKSPLLQFITPRSLFLIIIPVSLVLIWFLWTKQALVIRTVVIVLISLFPFCLFTFGQALWAATHFPGQPAIDLPSAPRLANARTTPRILWVIFDEWDYRLTFIDRPASVSMPAVDRFAAQSLSAQNAYSPAIDTGTSVPCLLTGRRLRMSPNVSHPRFSAQEVDGLSRVPWKEMPNIFSVARQAGMNTTAVGWYLPYCRMFNAGLTECAWWAMPTQATSTGDTYLEKIYGQTRSLLETDSLSPFGQSLAIRQKTAIYKDFLQRAEAAVSDPAMGMTLLHVPVPHGPPPYNRRTGKFDLKNNPVKGYFDSLVLLDQMLATLRADMERAGLWDKATVVLSSDHPCRYAETLDGKSDPRIPFLLKLPGDTTGAKYDLPLHSIVTARLLLAVMHGEVSGRADAISWLKQHQNILEAPVGESGTNF